MNYKKMIIISVCILYSSFFIPLVNAQIEVDPDLFFYLNKYNTKISFSYAVSFNEIKIEEDKIWFNDNWFSVQNADITINDWFKTDDLTLKFSASASESIQSFIQFYCNGKNKPEKIYLNGQELIENAGWSYDYLTKILSISLYHSFSVMEISIKFWDCSRNGISPIDGLCHEECDASPGCDDKEPGTGCCSGCFSADRNSDNLVDIFDIVIVAKSFGSLIGDPIYDPVADINHDSRIDIFDVVPVAIKFGTSC